MFPSPPMVGPPPGYNPQAGMCDQTTDDEGNIVKRCSPPMVGRPTITIDAKPEKEEKKKGNKNKGNKNKGNKNKNGNKKGKKNGAGKKNDDLMSEIIFTIQFN